MNSRSEWRHDQRNTAQYLYESMKEKNTISFRQLQNFTLLLSSQNFTSTDE